MMDRWRNLPRDAKFAILAAILMVISTLAAVADILRGMARGA